MQKILEALQQTSNLIRVMLFINILYLLMILALIPYWNEMTAFQQSPFKAIACIMLAFDVLLILISKDRLV